MQASNVTVTCADPTVPDGWQTTDAKAGLFLVHADGPIKKGTELLQDYGDEFWPQGED
jgi:hypothetical protein